jgi:pimeloyl-ACP methyl ester carboxylesterase
MHRSRTLVAGAVIAVATTAGAPAARAHPVGAPSGPGTPPPAPPAAIRFADVRLTSGVRLRYAEQGDPSGEAVILLHGYTDSWFSFSRLLPHIPARYHVFALDQRGHGSSDRPVAGYHMRDLAGDVIAFMDAKGIARATIVGHSMGSFVAQQVVVAAPGRVARLVLLSSATSPRALLGMDELEQAVDTLADPISERFAREFQESTVHQPLPDEFMDAAVAESLRLPADVWRRSLAGLLATGLASGIGDARIPTLLVWGERDAMCTRAEQDALLALIPGAVLKVHAETGHAVHWERPAEVARELVEFLATPSSR